MFKSFDHMKEAIRQNKVPPIISVAQANDEEVLQAVKLGVDQKMIQAVLVGDGEPIEKLCKNIGLEPLQIVHAREEDVMRLAIDQIHKGNASVLMKGLLNTSVFMRGVLNKEWGLRGEPDSLLSLLAVYEHPKYHKLIFCADSGINALVDYVKKEKILFNSLQFMAQIGYNQAKVALLTANELYDPNIEASRDAKLLSELDFSSLPMETIVEGPISFDIAFSKVLAEHKGFESQVSGDPDFILFPNMETGNVLGKTWLLFDEALWASVVLGAKVPVILGSRSDTMNVKLNSIVLGCLAGAVLK